LRELIEHADARAESLRESWVRMEIIDAGLTVPELQLWVSVPGLGRRRLDLGYHGRKVAVEYDGAEHHSEDEDVESDQTRRAALERLGWYVIVVRAEDLEGVGLERWLCELREVLAARSPSRPPRYARAERRQTRR
jgi:very-short-patch-repair endonuclease